jgi:catechol 2,3-dioxygenase-like lactoylglutathione lyase family enzyme
MPNEPEQMRKPNEPERHREFKQLAFSSAHRRITTAAGGAGLEPRDRNAGRCRRALSFASRASYLIRWQRISARRGVRTRSGRRRATMRKLQSQGVHHITLVGADRETSIDFWEGVLGMPFVFEQPNLDQPAESHLYFDPGDGRLITVFTDEGRRPDPTRTSTDIGAVHHLAFAVSRATFQQAVQRLDERGIRHSGVKDRGFMDSIYFTDPLGLLIELASYRFEPPADCTHADVLMESHRIRIERGDYAIAEIHLADAIERLTLRGRPSLSEDRSPKDPY